LIAKYAPKCENFLHMERTSQRLEPAVAEPQVARGLRPVARLVSWFKQLISLKTRREVTSTLHGPAGEDRSPTREECLAQIDRIANSSPLSGSESLAKLLRYLADHTLNSPVDHIKEYQIATEVLGRPPGFDPQSDSSVRVQVGRLRHKLFEYCELAGSQDTVLVDIPKGRYALSFQYRIAAAEDVAEIETTTRAPRISGAVLLAVAMMVSAAIGAIVIHEIDRTVGARGARTGSVKGMPAALRTFWGPFFEGQDAPFIVFSNAEFVGDPAIAMHYYNPSQDAPGPTMEHYTGVGELMGAVRLDRLSEQFGRQFRLKRGGLFTLDDALNSNLIFLGSPTENAPLAKIPNAHEFVFGQIHSGEKGWWGVVNVDPLPGEMPGYPSAPPVSPSNQDLAVIVLRQGFNPNRRTLILEGITTLGTQAAVDFVCDEASMGNLLHSLNVKPGGSVPLFEALLQVNIAGDVALGTRLVAAHLTPAKPVSE